MVTFPCVWVAVSMNSHFTFSIGLYHVFDQRKSYVATYEQVHVSWTSVNGQNMSK